MEIALRKTYELEELAMKPIILGLFCALFQAGVAAAPSGDAEAVYKAMFVKHWQISKEFTLAATEAMPAELQFQSDSGADELRPADDPYCDAELGQLCDRDPNQGTTINAVLDRRATRGRDG